MRHNSLFCPAGITECDRYFHIGSLHEELNSEQWLKRVAPFLEEHLGTTYGAMSPAADLIGNGGGKYALADPAHHRILVFLMGKGDSWDASDGGGVALHMTGVAGQFKALWFNPRSGSIQDAGNVGGGQNHTFQPPTTKDWVLVLKKQ